MFEFIKKFIRHYKLITATTKEIMSLENQLLECHDKKQRVIIYTRLIGVRLFFKEITGKHWKSEKPILRLEKLQVADTTHKKT